MVLGRISGSKMGEVMGGWRKCIIMSSIVCTLNIRMINLEWVRAYSRHGKMRNVCKILIAKHEGKRPRGRHRYGWEDGIKIYLKWK
jgi:hypothetical protein